MRIRGHTYISFVVDVVFLSSKNFQPNNATLASNFFPSLWTLATIVLYIHVYIIFDIFIIFVEKYARSDAIDRVTNRHLNSLRRPGVTADDVLFTFLRVSFSQVLPKKSNKYIQRSEAKRDGKFLIGQGHARA